MKLVAPKHQYYKLARVRPVSHAVSDAEVMARKRFQE